MRSPPLRRDLRTLLGPGTCEREVLGEERPSRSAGSRTCRATPSSTAGGSSGCGSTTPRRESIVWATFGVRDQALDAAVEETRGVRARRARRRALVQPRQPEEPRAAHRGTTRGGAQIRNQLPGDDDAPRSRLGLRSDRVRADGLVVRVRARKANLSYTDLDVIAERYTRLVLAMGRHDAELRRCVLRSGGMEQEAERDSLPLSQIAGSADR